MELRQLRAFVAVVRHGTFRAAAESLHLTQPALWQQVRSLQDELGVALFERSGRRVRVTTAGVQLLERADAVLGASTRMHELAAAIRLGHGGVVSIASPAPPVQQVLARVIGEVSLERPEIRIELRDATIPLDALRAGEVDLAVGPRADDLAGVKLYRVDVRIVVARGHRFAAARRVHVRKLVDEPLLTAPAGALSYGLLDRACARAGFAPRVRVASHSPAMLVALARAGFGVAVVANDALAGLVPHALPRVVDDAQDLVAEAWLHWRHGSELPAAARHFVDRVRAAVG